MGDFAGSLRQRIREARAAVAAASEAGDAYGVDACEADLAEMLRLAERHGVQVTPDSNG